MQGGGFYVGVAFWAGGTIEDWGPVYDSATNYTGLSPCGSGTEYNETGLTHQEYLVSDASTPISRDWDTLLPSPASNHKCSVHVQP